MAGLSPRRLAVVIFCGLVAAAPGVAAQLVNVQPLSSANGGGVTVSATGTSDSSCVSLLYTCAPGVAVSGTNNASSGGVAAAGAGSTQAGFVALSAGEASSYGAAVSAIDNSTGNIAAVTVFGDAQCRGGASTCMAISLTGHATNGTAISGCDLMSSIDLQANCGENAFLGTYWAVFQLMN